MGLNDFLRAPRAVDVSEPADLGAEDELERALRDSEEFWDETVARHRLAPPDAGFSDRLDRLAAAARARAQLCQIAHYEGYNWTPHTGTPDPPWELHPDSGRRGPIELWRIFDQGVAEFARAGRGTDLLAVSRALAWIARAARDLSHAVARADRASGLLPPSEEDTMEYWLRVMDRSGGLPTERSEPRET